jgi:flagellar biosynthesis/type III secretory pathway M-ring protein FliF/YscJ
MEENWLIIISVIVGVIGLIGLLIYRNQKDKKDLMKTLTEEDQVTITRDPDTEVDPVSEK